MRRILVPLDGTPFSASILPDAKRLAGPGGTLVLIRDATSLLTCGEHGWDHACYTTAAAEEYLERLAFVLRREGYDAHPEVFIQGGPNAAIEEAIKLFHPDMVACATHARATIARMVYKSVAWRAVGQSPVPVLLRHAVVDHPVQEAGGRRIMLPLDGSTYAERAIPLAVELAAEWDASLWLIRVTPELTAAVWASDHIETVSAGVRDELADAHTYLATIRQELPGRVYTEVIQGSIIPALTRAAERRAITDVVMGSHGRTGLSKVILGSVAEGLLHQLTCPIITVPALAAQPSGQTAAAMRIPVEV